MNIPKFSLSTQWIKSDSYWLDTSTKEQYPYTPINEMKGKSGILAFATPFAHTALGIRNMAIRFFRLVTFYNFWKKVETEGAYNFKARLIDTGKDAARFIGQPFGIIALTIVSVIGIFKPLDSMKVYYQLEKALYGRPFMAQMIDFVPMKAIEDESSLKKNPTQNFSLTDQGTKSKTEENKSEPNPTPGEKYDFSGLDLRGSGDEKDTSEVSSITESESSETEEETTSPRCLEDKLNDIIENTNQLTLNKDIIETFTSYIVDSDIESGNFETWIHEQIKIAQEILRSKKINPKILEFTNLLPTIVRSILPTNDSIIDCRNINSKLLRKSITIPEIKKEAIKRVDEHLNTCNLKNTENFHSNILNLIKLFALVHNHPDLKTDAFQEKRKEIENGYIQNFKAMMNAAANQKMDVDIRNSTHLLQVLLEKLQNKDLADGVLNELLDNRFDWESLESYFYYITNLYFLKDALIKAKGAKNSSVNLENFPILVEEILKPLPKKDPKNPYLEFFRIQIKLVIEDLANGVHDLLEYQKFDLNNRKDADLNRNIKETIEKINEEFDLDIEVEFHMETENDELVTAKENLIVSIPEALEKVNADDVEAWLIGKDHTHELKEFAKWLDKDSYYLTLKEIWNPELEKTMDNLYNLFLQESFSF